jgi:hypothetical protein
MILFWKKSGLAFSFLGIYKSEPDIYIEFSPASVCGASSCLYQQLINLCAQYLEYGTYPGALTCGGVGLVHVSINS